MGKRVVGPQLWTDQLSIVVAPRWACFHDCLTKMALSIAQRLASLSIKQSVSQPNRHLKYRPSNMARSLIGKRVVATLPVIKFHYLTWLYCLDKFMHAINRLYIYQQSYIFELLTASSSGLSSNCTWLVYKVFWIVITAKRVIIIKTAIK